MGEEVISVDGEIYILSTSSRIGHRTHVLKHGNTFAVFDQFGDAGRFGSGESGIYHQDTRFLSRLVLKLDQHRPRLLSSSISDDNSILTVNLVNPNLPRANQTAVPAGTVHILRSKLIWDDVVHEQICLHNYGAFPADICFTIEFEADFVDIFEVRGVRRSRRGRMLPAEVTADMVLLSYRGLDDRVRRTRVTFDPPPERLTPLRAHYEARLQRHAEMQYRCVIGCELPADAGRMTRPSRQSNTARAASLFDEAASSAIEAFKSVRADDTEVSTSNEEFNKWLDRSFADLHMLRTETRYGLYPYAGVPWYSTAFGRDGIITALECLWCNPALARGVLAYLAATQAEIESAVNEAEPGKVLHESRSGEMAATGEVPFGRYYGSVDATPLFIMLAGAYYDRTGDRAFTESIWLNVERALSWIDRYGDRDGDGFVEYQSRSPNGLGNQGWKDSSDSVFHSNGEPAEGPIALCEVQGYVYAAKRAAAELARVVGAEERAQELANQAETLRRRFDDAFWCDELSTYALALDGRKRSCCVCASNAGHCLFTGIATKARAVRVAATLTDKASFSGWGIRTLAATEARYNPMSYHNGSVWPHDSAIIAAGFARYGLGNEAAKIMSALFEVSRHVELHRLPELLCGFERRPGQTPTLYPVACAPQAWAAGAAFLLVQAALGLSVLPLQEKLIFSKPAVPEFLKQITLRNLRIGEASVDLSLTRHAEGVRMNVLKQAGDLEIVMLE